MGHKTVFRNRFNLTLRPCKPCLDIMSFLKSIEKKNVKIDNRQ